MASNGTSVIAPKGVHSGTARFHVLFFSSAIQPRVTKARKIVIWRPLRAGQVDSDRCLNG